MNTTGRTRRRFRRDEIEISREIEIRMTGLIEKYNTEN